MKTYLILLVFLLLTKDTFCQDTIDDYGNFFILYKNRKSYIVDKNHLKRQSEFFDTLYSDRTLIFGKTNNLITVFTKDSVKKVCSNIRAIHLLDRTNQTYQVLIHNKIEWLDDSFRLHKEDPNIYRSNVVCGNVPGYDLRIQEYSDSVFLRAAITSGQNFMEKPKQFRYNLKQIFPKEPTFLNGSSQFLFDGNYEFKFGIKCLTFIEKTVKNKYNIIQLDSTDGVFTKKIQLENIDKYYNNGYKPFIFQKGELYGYYPFNKQARYTFLMPFNGNFARFNLKNGIKGWLDTNGVEYIDE